MFAWAVLQGFTMMSRAEKRDGKNRFQERPVIYQLYISFSSQRFRHINGRRWMNRIDVSVYICCSICIHMYTAIYYTHGWPWISLGFPDVPIVDHVFSSHHVPWQVRTNWCWKNLHHVWNQGFGHLRNSELRMRTFGKFGNVVHKKWYPPVFW